MLRLAACRAQSMIRPECISYYAILCSVPTTSAPLPYPNSNVSISDVFPTSTPLSDSTFCPRTPKCCCSSRVSIPCCCCCCGCGLNGGPTSYSGQFVALSSYRMADTHDTLADPSTPTDTKSVSTSMKGPGRRLCLKRVKYQVLTYGGAEKRDSGRTATWQVTRPGWSLE